MGKLVALVVARRSGGPGLRSPGGLHCLGLRHRSRLAAVDGPESAPLAAAGPLSGRLRAPTPLGTAGGVAVGQSGQVLSLAVAFLEHPFPLAGLCPLSLAASPGRGLLGCPGCVGTCHFGKRVKASEQWLQGLLALALPTTLLLFVGGIQVARQPAKPIFRPAEEVAAFHFLAEETQGEAVVLASYETGNVLPAWAPVFVVIGHGPESVGLSERRPKVERFYRADTPEKDRMALLDAYDVEYVFWGPAERALGDWDPHTDSDLQAVYDQDGYTIFATK